MQPRAGPRARGSREGAVFVERKMGFTLVPWSASYKLIIIALMQDAYEVTLL